MNLGSTGIAAIEAYKKCCRCGQVKPSTSEYFARRYEELTGACRECLRAEDKNLYQKYRVEIREKLRLSESRKETTRKYRQTHKKQLNAAMVVYRNTHPEYREKSARLKKLYKAEHPEKNVEWINARRARKLSNGGRFTAEEWKNLKTTCGNKCLCCGAAESQEPLEADHVIPLSAGGSNSIDNIQPLCRSCNSSKYTKTIDYRLPEAA